MAASPDHPLAPRCAECVFFGAGAVDGLCRRHAPSPGAEEFEIVYWPKVKPDDRCGHSAAITDGTGPAAVRCETCIHWYQPGDEPVQPDYRQGLSAEWWARSGFCTRNAPAPSPEEDRRAFWRITHADAACGDGDAIPA